MATRYTSRQLLKLWSSVNIVPLNVYTNLRKLGISSVRPTHRGISAGQHDVRTIPVRVTARKTSWTHNLHTDGHVNTNTGPTQSPGRKFTFANLNILTPIPKAKVGNTSVNTKIQKLNVCCLNVCSVKNKTVSLSDYITSNDFDLVALTETVHLLTNNA